MVEIDLNEVAIAGEVDCLKMVASDVQVIQQHIPPQIHLGKLILR